MFILTNELLTGTLSSNGYRFPPFQFSLLSTAIVNIKENSLLSSFITVSTLRLVIGHMVVPIGTSCLWLLRVRTPHSSASVHLSLFVGARSGIVTAFCLHIIQVKALGQVVQSLLQKGAFDLAPLSSLGYYSRLFLYQEGLGVVAANIISLAFVRKIHHPEGSVSAFSDASIFRILSSVHGVRQSFPVLGSLHDSAGLHAGLGYGSEFSPQSWIRLRPYLRGWLIQASSRE